jgi:hypothetical protein
MGVVFMVHWCCLQIRDFFVVTFKGLSIGA